VILSYTARKNVLEKLLQNEIFKQGNFGDFQKRAVNSELGEQSWF